MRRKICAVIAFISFFWVMGIVGSADIGRITGDEFIRQEIPAMSTFVLSLWIGGFLG